jgi:hypothetical protein
MIYLPRFYSHTFYAIVIPFFCLQPVATSFLKDKKRGIFKPAMVEDAFVLYRNPAFLVIAMDVPQQRGTFQ